ncbi:hypothetical protein [Paenibacillus bouchesdurhonensis]|uniref:hypothetical protein n=1 Tax=Paenibacillus bouchesdurhonensis TaxID=1870990 RepID=UPI000DA63A10|nr:hypothetical protein [Paenibacillus bouchesdurhonensis]
MWIWMIGLFIIVIIAAVWAVIAITKKNSSERRKDNIVQLTKRRRAMKNSETLASRNQKCSRCNKAKRLIFYSNDWGHVAGLCKECRKEIGDKQELYPI